MSTIKTAKKSWILRLPLGVQISWIYLCLIVFCTVITYLLLNNIIQYLCISRFKNLGEIISKNTANLITHMVIAEDYLSIKTILLKATENDLIKYAAVYSPDNTTLASTLITANSHESVVQEFLTPIYWQNNIIGYLFMELRLHEQLTEIKFFTTIISCSIVLLFIVLLYIIWIYITKINNHVLSATNKLYKSFDKKAGKQPNAIASLSILANYAIKDKENKYLLNNKTETQTAKILIKIKDTFFNKYPATLDIRLLLEKLHVVAALGTRYFFQEAKITKINNDKMIIITIEKNINYEHLVLCAFTIHDLISKLTRKSPYIGMSFNIYPYNRELNHKINIVPIVKLAEFTTTNTICILQQNMKYISKLDIDLIQHKYIANALVVRCMKKLCYLVKEKSALIAKKIQKETEKTFN